MNVGIPAVTALLTGALMGWLPLGKIIYFMVKIVLAASLSYSVAVVVFSFLESLEKEEMGENDDVKNSV